MSAGKENFLKAHWDVLVLCVGLAALGAGGFYLFQALSVNPEDGAAEYEARLNATKPSHEGVAAANLEVFDKATRMAKTPPALYEIDPKSGSFLSSERRVICQKGDPEAPGKACGKPIPASLEKCPFCGIKQKYVKVEADTDHDGMPNDWEKKYGLAANDPNDAAKDADGDGFTNLEEYQAKTDPKDPESHPDYLDYLSVAGQLRQTTLPFYFNGYTPLPGGKFRFTFQRLGKTGYDSKFSPVLNEEIAGRGGRDKTGWIVTAFDQKSEMQLIKGSKTGMKKKVDVSTVTIKRAKDGKEMVIRVNDRNITIETEADLAWSRDPEKKIVVTPGSEFELKGRKYKMVKLAMKDGAVEAVVLDLKTKKEKKL